MIYEFSLSYVNVIIRKHLLKTIKENEIQTFL